MITLIIPTFNRAYALQQVLDTFYRQKKVSEIVFVDDGSDDNTEAIINEFAAKFENIKTVYLKNEKRSGASFSRKKGLASATNEYVLFCDDDEFLSANYAEICLKKVMSGKADIASGRHLYREVGESFEDAVFRFKNGLTYKHLFGKIRFKLMTDSIFLGDTYVPFTHGIFLTSKRLLKEYPIDPFYSNGNGYREETDFQMNAFLNNKKILITNDTHCVHMNMKEVKTGGQRVNRMSRFFYNNYYTYYFLKKYYPGIKKKMDISYPFFIAMILFFIAEFYDFFILPFWKLLKLKQLAK